MHASKDFWNDIWKYIILAKRIFRKNERITNSPVSYLILVKFARKEKWQILNIDNYFSPDLTWTDTYIAWSTIFIKQNWWCNASVTFCRNHNRFTDVDKTTIDLSDVAKTIHIKSNNDWLKLYN